MTGLSQIQLLDWDTRFFGRRIARLRGEKLSREELESVVSDAKSQGVECIYFLAELDDLGSLDAAVSCGFRMMDLRVTLEQTVPDVSSPDGVRTAGADDVSALRNMCRGAFKDSRFARDRRFAVDADRLYETWVTRAVEGLANAVLVAEDREGNAMGFACCHRRSARVGELGLTAVRGDQQGLGVGRRLVSAALAWFHRENLESAFVVTNGTNIAAQRLYQRSGFLTRDVQVWFHAWLDKE